MRKDNDKVITGALTTLPPQPFFDFGVADKLNARFDFTLCEEVYAHESAPITYHL
ncbi:MAG: hypothetical protein MRQ11_02770 [Candidatus Midichloria mitochondrii]|uniref:hypothetical protein n=1 Tax=Candidatus Midichloria mitochondrii TaxID=234827 RepID=UPI0002E9E702|nr:hypothetical protein [Candidatus Midichloria mitochondrii]MDJ1256298.1 hypothetical protein [Candidatus Midichloria mitochondrii]MDJ1313046.1 hypothetical protein [Candidatus Midichloria mitochondrii]MDJ1583602.1 hypothetical protein [Candidatus Midichloria mitochondrii]